MNPIPVNSADIASFGFKSIFKLYEKLITLDISGVTVFSGTGQSDVQGVYFEVIDPSGLKIKALNFSSPDIDPSSATSVNVAIPNLVYAFGWWQIKGVIRDSEGVDTTVNIKVEVCAPVGFGEKIDGAVVGTFESQVNCSKSYIKLSETTNLTYKGKSAISAPVKSGFIYYPQGSLDPAPISFTPVMISGAQQIYTGNYKIKNTTTANYDLGDLASLQVKYFTNQDFQVECTNSLNSVICCIEKLLGQIRSAPNSGQAAIINNQLKEIQTDLFMAQLKETSGQDASEYVSRITKVLNCDCGGKTHPVEPRPLSTGDNIVFNIEGSGATDVDRDDTNPDNILYTISSKLVSISKAVQDDLSFSITKTETTGEIKYEIGFDYAVLSDSILSSIQASQDLIDVLRDLVAASSDISLESLNGKCVDDFTEATYTIIEKVASVGVQYLVNIVVAGVTFNAPNNLQLTSTASVATWLNSLGKGTFTVSLDNSSNSIIIKTENNTNKFSTALIRTIVSGVPTDNIRQFAVTGATITTVLQSIIDYVCSLNLTQVKLDNTYYLKKYDNSGNVITQSFTATQKLSDLLAGIIDSQGQLFTAVKNTSVTCDNVKPLFVTNNVNVDPTSDVVYGNKSTTCASYTFSDIANAVLVLIAQNSGLKAQFDALVASGGIPVCDPVTNATGSYANGDLTFSANGWQGATDIQIRYRLLNSGAAYTELTLDDPTLPYTVEDVPAGQYEIGIRKKCPNISAWSVWSIGTSTACPAPINFAASRSGNNFAIIYGLSAGQTKLQVEITDPNNGKSVVPYTGSQSGNFTTPISPLLNGNYLLRARAVCNDVVNPPYVSEWTAATTVLVSNGCNAPVIGVIINQVIDTNTITKRVNITSYTSNVRVRAVDNSTGAEISNQIVATSGYVDVTLFKNKQYTVTIYNVCPGGVEMGAETVIDTNYVALQARLANVENDICDATPQTVYVSATAGEISAGVAVYTNSSLTSPLTGFTFIENPQSDIFNINTSTGVVGVATGNQC